MRLTKEELDVMSFHTFKLEIQRQNESHELLMTKCKAEIGSRVFFGCKNFLSQESYFNNLLLTPSHTFTYLESPIPCDKIEGVKGQNNEKK